MGLEARLSCHWARSRGCSGPSCWARLSNLSWRLALAASSAIDDAGAAAAVGVICWASAGVAATFGPHVGKGEVASQRAFAAASMAMQTSPRRGATTGRIMSAVDEVERSASISPAQEIGARVDHGAPHRWLWSAEMRFSKVEMIRSSKSATTASKGSKGKREDKKIR